MQITQYSGSPVVARETLGEFDFGGFLDKISTAATNIYTAKVTTDAQKAEAKRQYELEKMRIQQQNISPDFLFDGGGGYSPIYGAPSAGGFPIMPVLLIGGVGLAAYLLLRK